MTAFEAIGRARDPRALGPLLDFVSNPENRDARRSLAADALGELGDAQAIAPLLQVVDGASEVRSFELALSAVIALAKLGDHSRAAVPLGLSAHTKDPSIRPRVAQALQYVIGPGLFSALQEMVRDKQVEVRLHTIDALFYLGVKESIAELITLANDKSPVVSTMSRARIADLSGEDFPDYIRVRDLRGWWKTNQDRFTQGVCYRLGERIWLPNIIALLAEPNMRERTVAELRMITGFDFGLDPLASIREQDDLLRNARAWWDKRGAGSFKSGHVYKYGYEQVVSDVL
jgi:HEAT repeat protein